MNGYCKKWCFFWQFCNIIIIFEILENWTNWTDYFCLETEMIQAKHDWFLFIVCLDGNKRNNQGIRHSFGFYIKVVQDLFNKYTSFMVHTWMFHCRSGCIVLLQKNFIHTPPTPLHPCRNSNLNIYKNKILAFLYLIIWKENL